MYRVKQGHWLLSITQRPHGDVFRVSRSTGNGWGWGHIWGHLVDYLGKAQSVEKII